MLSLTDDVSIISTDMNRYASDIDTPALRTSGLSIGYGRGRHLHALACGLDLDLAAGEITCLLGANGAGKSTLLRTLARQQPMLGGRVEICGRDISRASLREVARLMSVVYTERTGAGGLTAREVVGLGRQPFTGFFGRLDAADRRIVDRSMEAVGITALAERYVATLSDGERQKVMIARALAQQAPVMILDEPTSFLDVASRLEVMALLRRIADENATAVLLSTHEITDALSIADRLWLMRPDHTLVSGRASALIADGALDRLFPGRSICFDTRSLSFRMRRGRSLDENC